MQPPSERESQFWLRYKFRGFGEGVYLLPLLGPEFTERTETYGGARQGPDLQACHAVNVNPLSDLLSGDRRRH